MLWLAAHFPMLGLETQCRAARAEADGGPAVLVEDARVVQANAQARQAGIAIGSTLATAHSIAAQLAYWPRAPEAERQRLAFLGLAGYRYTSRVSLAPPAGLLLEVRGSVRLFGGLAALTAQVAAGFQSLGHAANLAAAQTPLASLALARAGLDGLPGDAAAALRQAPLASTDLPAKVLERLADMGIQRLGQLLELPTPELGMRFEPLLVDYLDRLTGRKGDPRQAIEPPERFVSSRHLAEPISSKDALLPPMRRLAAELARWLAIRRFGAGMLRWTFKPLAGTALDMDIRLADASADDRSFLALSQLKLDAAELPAEVMSLVLRADLVTPAEPVTGDLLGRRDERAPARVQLADLLTAKLGEDAVRRLQAVDDHRPEAAWSAAALVSAGSRTKAAVGRASRTREPVPRTRPLWLVDPPQPVHAKHFEVLSGPERIATGWWDAPVARDYFIAVAGTGAQCWLYRDHDGAWYLHGYFA